MSDGWLSDDEQEVWRAYLRANQLLHARLNRQLQRDTGFSEADYAVLVHLSEAPDDRMRGYELAAVIQWEKSRLSHHLTRMEKRGLVRREECPTDGRGAFIALTEEGRRRIEAAAPLHVSEVRRLFFDALSADQTTELGEICGVLVEALEAGAPDLCTEADGAADECGNSDRVAEVEE
jgi:DNA-binding MarR family transcriptional regulator